MSSFSTSSSSVTLFPQVTSLSYSMNHQYPHISFTSPSSSSSSPTSIFPSSSSSHSPSRSYFPSALSSSHSSSSHTFSSPFPNFPSPSSFPSSFSSPFPSAPHRVSHRRRRDDVENESENKSGNFPRSQSDHNMNNNQNPNHAFHGSESEEILFSKRVKVSSSAHSNDFDSFSHLINSYSEGQNHHHHHHQNTNHHHRHHLNVLSTSSAPLSHYSPIDFSSTDLNGIFDIILSHSSSSSSSFSSFDHHNDHDHQNHHHLHLPRSELSNFHYFVFSSPNHPWSEISTSDRSVSFSPNEITYLLSLLSLSPNHILGLSLQHSFRCVTIGMMSRNEFLSGCRHHGLRTLSDLSSFVKHKLLSELSREISVKELYFWIFDFLSESQMNNRRTIPMEFGAIVLASFQMADLQSKLKNHGGKFVNFMKYKIGQQKLNKGNGSANAKGKGEQKTTGAFGTSKPSSTSSYSHSSSSSSSPSLPDDLCSLRLTRDQWRSLYEFSLSVDENSFNGYSLRDSSWPTLIDEMVMWTRRERRWRKEMRGTDGEMMDNGSQGNGNISEGDEDSSSSHEEENDPSPSHSSSSSSHSMDCDHSLSLSPSAPTVLIDAFHDFSFQQTLRNPQNDTQSMSLSSYSSSPLALLRTSSSLSSTSASSVNHPKAIAISSSSSLTLSSASSSSSSSHCQRHSIHLEDNGIHSLDSDEENDVEDDGDGKFPMLSSSLSSSPPLRSFHSLATSHSFPPYVSLTAPSQHQPEREDGHGTSSYSPTPSHSPSLSPAMSMSMSMSIHLSPEESNDISFQYDNNNNNRMRN